MSRKRHLSFWSVMRPLVAVICLLHAAAPVFADEFYYTRMRGDGSPRTGLFKWNDVTGAQSQMGGDGVYLREPTDGELTISGLAAMSDGTLYGFAVDDRFAIGFRPLLGCALDNNRSRLVRIDPNTATLTYVGPWRDARTVAGAGFDGQGRLWTLDCYVSAAIEIDPTTGAEIGAPIGFSGSAAIDLRSDIDFTASGWAIVGVPRAGFEMRMFDTNTRAVATISNPTMQNQGFDTYGISGMAFTSHLDARNGSPAARECRLNILDVEGADELGHYNDRFDNVPAVAFKEATQYDPPALPFTGDFGDMTRVNGPVLPSCVYDWGDAPAMYASRANNGARHRIVPGAPFLGAQRPDFEMDAPSTTEGDNDPLLADEDGVVLPASLTRGTTTSMEVQITAGNVGPDTRVQAWVDWNSNQNFNDAGEQILTDAVVVEGLNTFNVPVPDIGPAGLKVVRFRIANESGLGPLGVAGSGEVEDYRLFMAGPADIRVTVTDDSDAYRPGTTVVYTITATNDGPYVNTLIRPTIPRPAGITTSSWTCTGLNGATCSLASGTNYVGSFPGTLVTNSMPVGSSVVYTFSIQVPSGFTGNLVQTASFPFTSPSAPDPDMSNNTATDTNVPARADVGVTTNGPARVPPGANLTFTIDVTNNGPQTATAVRVNNPTPLGLTFVSTSGACTTAFPCMLGDLPAGQTRTIAATYRVPSNYTSPAPITNFVSVTNTTTDPVLANNSSTRRTDLAPPQSDIQIVKHVSAAAVTPGETFTYTLQVKNNGPSNAVNVVVTDPLPPQVTFDSSAAGCTAVDRVVTCPAIAAMNVGDSASFDIVVRLDPAYTGNGTDILNSASVTSDTEDPALQNNANPAGAPPIGPAGADLTLVKSVSSDVVAPGQHLTYTLLVSNQGPSVATDIVVTDPLPAALTFVSSAEGCTAAGQLVTCPTIPTLAPGESVTFTLVAQLDPSYSGDGTDLDNRATVQSPTPDPVPNNTTPPVRPNLGVATADLTSTKVAIGNAISPGIVFTYRITVTNAGPSSAADVVVTDALPAPLTFVSSPSGCTAAGQVVACTRASVLPGTTATFDLLVRLDPAYVGDGSDLVNTATVASSTPDATPDNNQPAPAPPPPVGIGEADVTIAKTGPIGVAPAGGEITYTIAVTNQGPNAATHVVVSDPTPPGLTFLETAGDCVTAFPCTLGTLAPGQVKTITARYAVDASVTGVISNTATVTSATPDPSPSNSTATAQTPPPPIPYYLAEGATGSFWSEDLAIANPNAAAAPVTLNFLKEDGSVITQTLTVAPASRTTVRVDDVEGLQSATSSAEITSEDGLPLAIERTMTWDASAYAAHTATAVTQPATRWYFAEGAQGLFHTFVLLENPQATPADVTVTFLREMDTPVVRTLTLGARSRATIQAHDVPELDGYPFGVVVEAAQPIVAERSMYLNTAPAMVWNGGHASAGVTEASQRWFYAEGATGTFFDTFILLANPQTIDAHVTMEYLLPDGTTISVPKTVPAQGRLTVNIEGEADERLHAATVSTRILSDVPIVTERSMYWNTKPSAFGWSEGHNSFGVDQAAARWAVADGRVGGSNEARTYILLSNPWTSEAEVQVTYLRENGAEPVVKTYVVPPTTRRTIDVAAETPELQDEAFGARIEVTNGLTISVERSVYWNANGAFWAAGTNAMATRLP
jgi:uncharacterized repeat protein (TIGR01451 family)